MSETATPTRTRRGTKAPVVTEVTDAAAAADASVLAGVTREPKAPARPRTAKTAPAKPEAKAEPKPTTPKPATRRGAKAPAPEPEVQPETNGKAETGAQAVKRVAKQTLARMLVDAAAKTFAPGVELPAEVLAGMTAEEARQHVANWLHSLPTGGGPGWLRYWPADFTRPSQFDWQPGHGAPADAKPEDYVK